MKFHTLRFHLTEIGKDFDMTKIEKNDMTKIEKNDMTKIEKII